MRAPVPLLLLIVAACLAACASAQGERGPALELGELAPSSTAIWQAAPLAPDIAVRTRAAERLSWRGRAGDSVTALRGIVADEPRALEAHRLLQDLLVLSPGDWWLRRHYAHLLASRPEDPDALYLAARIEPDRDRQAALFESALDRAPRHPYARIGRALTLLRDDEHQAALDEAHAAAESAPDVRLPWKFMSALALRRGERVLADRLFAEMARRFPDDPAGYAGRMRAAFDEGRLGVASAHAVDTLERAPGDGGVLAAAVRVLAEAAVPRDCARAADGLVAARHAVADRGSVDLAIGRLRLAAGDAPGAEVALVRARDEGGLDPFEVARYLRSALVMQGRYAAAVGDSLAALPSDVLAPGNLYAARWKHLIQCSAAADARPDDAMALSALAAALRSVGWRREAAVVRVRAAAAAPADAALRAAAADERAFDRFLADLAGIARELRDLRLSGGETPSLAVALDRTRAASLRRLGRDVLDGVRVRSYPLLGDVAASVGSGGVFARELDARGLLLLFGERRGEGLQIVLGRIALVRSDASATVLGHDLTFDECWLETSGLPPDLTGFRGGLAGLTVDRLVLIQLETCLRAPEPLVAGIPFEERAATDASDLVALDTPSAVAQRIELALEREARVGHAVLDAVRRHELGHVLDARRMLPLAAHPLRALDLLVSSGFDGARVEQELEGRAAIVALIESRVPRAALAGLLGFLPEREGGTAHTAGYRRAVEVALALIREDPASFPSLLPERNLLQQMDRLTDDEIRLLGKRLLGAY